MRTEIGDISNLFPVRVAFNKAIDDRTFPGSVNMSAGCDSSDRRKMKPTRRAKMLVPQCIL